VWSASCAGERIAGGRRPGWLWFGVALPALTESPMRADPAWKSALLHKGQDVSEQLEAVLAGQQVDLASLPVPSGPDQTPETRLRKFLAQIERAIAAFETEAFGRCEVCGVDLARAALERQPWLMNCPAHAARWVS